MKLSGNPPFSVQPFLRSDVSSFTFRKEAYADQKVVNNPENVVADLLEGLLAACDGAVKSLGTPNAMIKTTLPPDKAGLLIGGGRHYAAPALSLEYRKC